MEGIDTAALPLWVQIVATLLTAIGGTLVAVRGYKVGTKETSAAPQQSNQPMLQLIGGQLADRNSMVDLIEAVRAIAEEIKNSNEETRALRRALDYHTEQMSKGLARRDGQ